MIWRNLGIVILAAAVLTAALPAHAQVTSTGIIKGQVFEDESGEPMPYTNVFIAGTNIGTMAFSDGYFFLRGLRPGRALCRRG